MDTDNSIYMYLHFLRQYNFRSTAQTCVLLSVKRQVISNLLIERNTFYAGISTSKCCSLKLLLLPFILIILCMYLFTVILYVYCFVSGKKNNLRMPLQYLFLFHHVKIQRCSSYNWFFLKQKQFMPLFNEVPNM